MESRCTPQNLLSPGITYNRSELMDLGISVRLVEYSRDGERLVAASSKVSLSGKTVEDILSMSEDEVGKWILETFRRQHFSPWEHSVYTFIIDGLSRVASHQLVRHRIASYTQLSHRYSEGYLRRAALEACRIAGMECPAKPKEDPAGRRHAYSRYAEALSRVAEESGEHAVGVARIAFVIPPSNSDSLTGMASSLLKASRLYYHMLAGGMRREDARYILPHALRTRIVVTMNARELVQSFLPLRMCTRAQWEIRYIAWSLWRVLAKTHPRLFKWAGPSCVFKENSGRMKPASLEDYLNGNERFTIPRCPELVENKAIRGCLLEAARPAGGDTTILE